VTRQLCQAPAVEDECRGDRADHWSVGLAVASVFIILIGSCVGVAFPLVAKYAENVLFHPRNWPWPGFVVTLGKHAGTGVLLALGFIHLLVPAIEQLESECLPAGFGEFPFAMLFALVAALFMHLLEALLLLLTNGAGGFHSHNQAAAAAAANGKPAAGDESLSDADSSSREENGAASRSATNPHHNTGDDAAQSATIATESPAHQPPGAHLHARHHHPACPPEQHDHVEFSDGCVVASTGVSLSAAADERLSAAAVVSELSCAEVAHTDVCAEHAASVKSDHDAGAASTHGDFKRPSRTRRAASYTRRHIHAATSAFVLELGLASHSVIIGITLGVSEYSEMVSALVDCVRALCVVGRFST